MEQKRAETMAREVIKSVVDLLSQKRYEEISTVAEMNILSTEDIKELVNEYLELNNFSHIDCFDAGCNFHPPYAYHQIEFYHFNDGSGFACAIGRKADTAILTWIAQKDLERQTMNT